MTYPPPAYPPRPVPLEQLADPTLAEWWQRLVARIVDQLVVGVLTSPVYIAYFIWLFGQISDSAEKFAHAPLGQAPAFPFSLLGLLGWVLAISAAVAVIGFVYDLLCHGKWGATLGKRIMKIKVVRLADREPIGGGLAAKRALVYPLVSIVPLFGGLFSWLDVLWIFKETVTRQCLHDKFAETVVIRLDPPRPRYGPPGYGPPPGYPQQPGPGPAGYPPPAAPGPGSPR